MSGLTFVNQTTRHPGIATGQDTITLPWTPGDDAGLCLMWHVGSDVAATVNSISGCGGNWQRILRRTRSTHVTEIWVCRRCDGVNANITVTPNIATTQWGYNVSGWAGLGPFEEIVGVPVFSSGDGNTAPVDPGSLVVFQDDVVIGSAHGDSNTQTVSAGPTTPGFTTMTSVLCDVDRVVRCAYLKELADTTQALQWTMSGTHSWVAGAAALRVMTADDVRVLVGVLAGHPDRVVLIGKLLQNWPS